MNIGTRFLGTLAIAVAAGSMMAGPAHAAVSCHKINAKGVGEASGNGETKAQIIGGGLLHGATTGIFSVTGGAPPLFSIAGSVTFTTSQGTLTVGVSGTFDVVNGNFVVSGPVTAATGKLFNATGTLVLDGIQDLATGKFIEDVSGSICVDLAP